MDYGWMFLYFSKARAIHPSAALQSRFQASHSDRSKNELPKPTSINNLTYVLNRLKKDESDNGGMAPQWLMSMSVARFQNQ
jgi:hypothetical protein